MQEHAKLLRYRDRQVLAHLNRTDEGLTVMIQLWCESQDEQLRVALNVDGDIDDEVIRTAFLDLTDDSLALTLDSLGVADLLEEAELAGRGEA